MSCVYISPLLCIGCELHSCGGEPVVEHFATSVWREIEDKVRWQIGISSSGESAEGARDRERYKKGLLPRCVCASVVVVVLVTGQRPAM